MLCKLGEADREGLPGRPPHLHALDLLTLVESILENPERILRRQPPDVTRDTKAFTAAIRTRVCALLRAWSIVQPSDDGIAWRVQQMPVDLEGLNDWVAELAVDLAASREQGEPVLLLRLGSLV